jgi:hypothetical protein
MSPNFTAIASILTVLVAFAYLIMDGWIRGYTLARSLYPEELILSFPANTFPPVPGSSLPVYFSRHDLEELGQLAPRESDPNRKLFARRLAICLGMEFRRRRSMKGIELVLVQPPAPKGEFFRLQHQTITLKNNAAVAPDGGKWEKELDYFRSAIIWYFAASALGVWVGVSPP